jgi:ABC-type cobalamin/Fe3+-siderophores transport system ATPase subunit
LDQDIETIRDVQFIRSGKLNLKSASPSIVVVAGPNGLGKSSVAPSLLRDAMRVLQYDHADVIAEGLAGFNPAGGSAP